MKEPSSKLGKSCLRVDVPKALILYQEVQKMFDETHFPKAERLVVLFIIISLKMIVMEKQRGKPGHKI